LDDTVDDAEILKYIEKSRAFTVGKAQVQKRGSVEHKAWLIPANCHYYDVDKAFDARDVIEWKQSSLMHVGDIVYMYISSPISAITYQCEVVETDIPFEYEDIYYNGYNGIVVCVEGYWYLHNLNNNRLIEDGFDIMIPIKSYVFASSEKVFYVLNYKGESIIEKEIPTYLDTFRSRNDAMVPTFKIEEEGTVVNIYIMENETDYDQYKFNTVNGELTEIIQ
jgi:hypothetical protein